jgi:hypothetical protein
MWNTGSIYFDFFLIQFETTHFEKPQKRVVLTRIFVEKILTIFHHTKKATKAGGVIFGISFEGSTSGCENIKGVPEVITFLKCLMNLVN